MNVEILNIHLADRLAGKLFRFDNGTTQALIRYVADEKFALDKQQKILSLGMRAASPDLQTSFWFDIKINVFYLNRIVYAGTTVDIVDNLFRIMVSLLIVQDAL